MKKSVLAILTLFCLVFLAITVGITIKNSLDLRHQLEDNIKTQMLSTCLAARQVVEEYDFVYMNSMAEVEEEAADYEKMISDLRQLAASTHTAYIYGLKMVDGMPMFFFDTDEEDTELFIPYEMADVHHAAFTGAEATGLFNVEDEYGSFHTAAVPIIRSGYVIGIVSVDIEDSLIAASYKASNRNITLLVIILLVVMATLMAFVVRLLRQIRDMQDILERQAHYDHVTGLPNRRYLFAYLRKKLAEEKNVPFAIFFIDLDNFKLVNDYAGHDAGDALLKRIGEFLQGYPPGKAFRPTAGRLNVSARVGGDEFIQVVPEIGSPAEAEAFAQKMLEDFLHTDFRCPLPDAAIGMSLGIALYPQHSEDFNVLIKYADLAMYHAKQTGKNRAVIYRPELTAKPEK